MPEPAENTIRIATRGSRLALWQTHHVAEKLRAANFNVEIEIIQTKGDLVLDRSLDKIGAKGVFTEELEESLRNGTVDIAVHSAKDLQSTLPDDLEILAFMEREKVNDVVISFDSSFTLDREQIVIGTSSTRRRALFKRYYPDIITAECRGNLQTRLQKLKDGQYDAILLAYAGVHRMQYSHLITEVLPEDKFVPAAGQGSIAIECAKNLPLSKKLALRNCLDHEPTHICLTAERAFLRTMEGGCSIPSFALATLHGAHLEITGGIVSLNGQQMINDTLQAPPHEADALGTKLAQNILGMGGIEILDSIKKARA
ncbi:hydroxymethylbilane synthase [Adhaeribacter swui]|uniref:Porphobilinogen deaminase n=1 Tax=Adhaeribacter swui TaxID=2086471 RepID=A0A7G7G8G7_9BACT|nr:hydroxymethylbilane synthase [Adhaeribacter swui]QNF33451.1 hydroxymethylbilane synthase [Adhaeribacter swui]